MLREPLFEQGSRGGRSLPSSATLHGVISTDSRLDITGTSGRKRYLTPFSLDTVFP